MKREELTLYRDLLCDIKSRVRQAQHRAALSANAEMILMYWDIGRMIATRQKEEGWGAGVIPRLAADLKNELPEQKGFSETNLKRMVQFSQEYPHLFSIRARGVPQLPRPAVSGEIGAQPVPQGQKELAPDIAPALSAFALLTWGHNVVLIQKIKMNFYCSAVDDLLRHEHDTPTIGLILCQTKDRIFAEYALRDVHKPIGVADYEFTRALPEELASSLPSIEDIEAEFSEDGPKEAGG